MYDAHEIASYVINWCHAHNILITNLKLQKLLYFIQGENCRIRHTRLISDDFYAWQLGPLYLMYTMNLRGILLLHYLSNNVRCFFLLKNYQSLIKYY